MSVSSETSSNPEKDTWSDLKCREISSKDFFPSQVADTDVQKEIVTNFLNFYLSGKVKRGVTVCDVIFAAISLMPRLESEEQFVWPSVEYKDDGTLFYISAEEKLRAEIRRLQIKRSIQKEESTDLGKEQLNKDLKEHASVAISEGENSINREHERDVEKSETEKEPRSPIGASMNPTEEIDAEESSDVGGNVKTQSTNESNDDKTAKEETEENEKPANKLFLPDKWTNFRGSSRETKSLNYGPLENAAFTAHCNKLLDAWHKFPKHRIQLKLLFGYLALTLLRSAAKSPKHLYNTFSSERFVTSMRQLIAWTGPFTVPQKKCVIRSHRVLTKKDAKIPTMFAKIVYYSLHHCIEVEGMAVAEFRNRIFTTTVLSHTFNYGLGIFNLVCTLQRFKSFGKMMEIIYDVTICDETKESWESLNSFVNEYLSEPKHSTYHWARIMDNNALKKLSCQHNYGLSVILSFFIEKEVSKANVWDSDWVKKSNQHQDLEYYKALAEKMHEIFAKHKAEILKIESLKFKEEMKIFFNKH